MKQDPLALAFFGAALALLAALLLYVFVLRKPEPAPPAGTPGTLETLRSRVEGAVDQLREKAAPAPAPAPAPVAKPAPAARPAGKPVPSAKAAAPARRAANVEMAPGHRWRYQVVVEPPVWRDITLTYRTEQESAGIGVLAEFVHGAGRMNFHLGTYANGHPSHANTRFPGFFMHPSYFQLPLQPGQKLSWGWPWQPAAPGRMKRYEGKVARIEQVTVPAGTFRAAVIEADLYYIEAGKVRAQAREILWFSPDVAIVKVVREGRTPDEGSTRIVAELVEYR